MHQKQQEEVKTKTIIESGCSLNLSSNVSAKYNYFKTKTQQKSYITSMMSVDLIAFTDK